ncbi:PREDICTED: RNA-binding protein MEX3B-like isoform X3 [Ipomoea nil]|uniref:RNA-binding protein MEX3B-like isoform X3 n=1 Tax=Ipomoea nil TaxID=35883 RepID=UPI0009015BD4|nr:PREDICTED: RNA-binding protein MEX3B-like isoform X3 [Ipomoea nil]XP_019194930.1 PREDICTED: RNA-binding protein MEX3B-like isoform X3 [Ipomoea nil]XP_019194931.1 PREDICTED: RNA-binding protein MEX3B-like isoform X3 [Ipomoea nil]
MTGWLDLNLWFACSFTSLFLVVIFVMVVALIVKLIGCFEDDDAAVPAGDGEINSTETSLLLPKEAAPAVIYGACEEEDDDVESGNCSRSSSSEDFYDGKICVICYDRKRCCFFIPCGHCATCYQCAKRISEGEGKICPFCRTSIQRIRRLFTP